MIFTWPKGSPIAFGARKFGGEFSFARAEPNHFVLYQHKGLNFSIFQNDGHIAADTKNRIKIAGGGYEIRMNDDANVLVVICMALAVDTAESEDDSSTVRYDFGNSGPEERKFDRSWEPN